MGILKRKYGGFDICLKCGILVLVLVGMQIYRVHRQNSRDRVKDPFTYTVQKGETLDVGDISKDEIPLRAGEEVKVLGAAYGSSYQNIWVETSKGWRGRIEIQDRDFVLEVARRYKISDTADRVLSNKKFENTFLGRSFEKNEKSGCPAEYVAMIDGVLKVQPFVKLYRKNGKYATPVISYDKEGNAVSYETVENRYNKHNMIPMLLLYKVSQFAMDIPLIKPVLTRSSIYQKDVEQLSFPMNILEFIFGILTGLLTAVWFICGWMIVPGLIFAAVRFPIKGFSEKFSNGFILISIKILSLVCLVLWVCAGMAIHLWLLFIPSIYVFYKFNEAVSYILGNYIPGDRCEKCAEMYTYVFDHKEFVREYNEKRNYSEYIGKDVSSTKKWKTWTDVTTITKRGDTEVSRSTHQKDIKNWRRETGTKHYHDFERLYHITEHDMFFRCQECGNIEKRLDSDSVLVDQKHVGYSSVDYDVTREE